MKRIILTESQYNRLVRVPLNETTIYENPEDSEKLTKDMLDTLIWVSGGLWGDYKKDLYVKKIEGDEIHINQSKYNEEEKRSIIFWYKKIFSDSDNIDEEKLIMYIGEDEPEVVIDEPEDGIDYDITKKYSRSEYIKLFKNISINQMNKYNIPASITLAQGIIESGNGNSKLAKNGKNHFGIKCHGWTGDKSYHDDDRPNECFRNYDKVEESYKDHSLFLNKHSIYDSLFDLDITDYKGWSKGLKKAGYATAPDYANTLISIIEANDLYQYDKKNNTITKNKDDVNKSSYEVSGGELYTPISTGNYFRKKNNKLYNSKGHSGHDYVAKNKKIVFMKDGKVGIAKFNNDSCGGTITIYVDNGNRKSIFCHLSEIYVNNGEEITSGTVIGVSGGGRNQKGAGHSTGHHLHYGMKKNNEFVDPLPFIDEFKLVKK